MKKLALLIVLAAGVGHAQAQSNASAAQTAQSAATAQGTIQFSQSPEHTTATVRNVGGVAAGSFAGSFSQFNCTSTGQGGIAIAGLTLLGGGPVKDYECALDVVAAENARQSTIDEEHRAALLQSAINLRCMASEDAYEGMMAAGLQCALKPKSMRKRTDTQPESTRIEH